MARRAVHEDHIYCSGGNTYLDAYGTVASYKNRWYWFRINPKIILPAYRTFNRKILFVNGKRRGYAEMRSGLIPLSRYIIPGKGLRISLQNFIRKYLGVRTKSYERGYSLITIKHYKYIVVRRSTQEGLIVCEVFDKRTEDQIGVLIFGSNFSELVTQTTRTGVTHTLHVIAGYVVDSLIYTQAATALTKSIKVYI